MIRWLRETRGLLRSLWMYYGIPGQSAKLRDFYAGLIPEPKLIFDIGAHVGNRSRAFAQLGAHVIAVEPQPAFARFLRRLFPDTEQVTILETAVGAEKGTADMKLSGNAPTVSSLADSWMRDVQRDDEGFSWVRWDETIQVPVTTLDALIESYGPPDFVKIDVEGFELAVLEGLSKPLPSLSFEFIRSALNHTWPCIKRLDLLGRYEYNLTIIEDTDFVLTNWVSSGALIAALQALPDDATSGDIYARLKREPA